MEMSTQIWRDSAALLETLLVDRLLVLDVGNPVTTGINVTRQLTQVSAETISGLVQSVSLENAVEGRVNQIYVIKVPQGTELEAGQAIMVFTCVAEPTLVGQVLLIDTISRNGLAMIRKGSATLVQTVNQEGKEILA